MNIDRIAELVAEFSTNGVHHSSKEVIEFQDLIGRATLPAIGRYSQSLEPNERHRFWFAITATLAPETAAEIIAQDARAFADKHITNVYERHYAELDRFNVTVGNQQSKIRELENERARDQGTIANLYCELSECKAAIEQLEARIDAARKGLDGRV